MYSPTIQQQPFYGNLGAAATSALVKLGLRYQQLAQNPTVPAHVRLYAIAGGDEIRRELADRREDRPTSVTTEAGA